jgi:peptidoglycan-N-acetylglucosamine deacetylase
VRVALTFDTEHPDRPCSGLALAAILETLADADAQATFFVQGRWARAFPEDARAIAAGGYRLGNHSHHHAPMDGLTESAFAEDVRLAEETIVSVTGADPRPWFRCPFGSGMEDETVLTRLESLGYRHAGWDVDPQDWDVSRDAATVESAVVDGVLEGAKDAVVLLHSWPDATAAALPLIVPRLRAEAVTFVGLDDLR